MLAARNGAFFAWWGRRNPPRAPGVGNDAAQRAGHLGFPYFPSVLNKFLLHLITLRCTSPQGLERGEPPRPDAGAARALLVFIKLPAFLIFAYGIFFFGHRHALMVLLATDPSRATRPHRTTACAVG